MGKKTWTPGKNLPKFIAINFGIPLREQSIILESIADAVSETVPLVRERMREHATFREIGKRMLLAWKEGVEGLCDGRIYATGRWRGTEAIGTVSPMPKQETLIRTIGRSPLLADRSKRRKKA